MWPWFALIVISSASPVVSQWTPISTTTSTTAATTTSTTSTTTATTESALAEPLPPPTVTTMTTTSMRPMTTTTPIPLVKAEFPVDNINSVVLFERLGQIRLGCHDTDEPKLMSVFRLDSSFPSVPSLNGRPPMTIGDPQHDLVAVSYEWGEFITLKPEDITRVGPDAVACYNRSRVTRTDFSRTCQTALLFKYQVSNAIKLCHFREIDGDWALTQGAARAKDGSDEYYLYSTKNASYVYNCRDGTRRSGSFRSGFITRFRVGPQCGLKSDHFRIRPDMDRGERKYVVHIRWFPAWVKELEQRIKEDEKREMEERGLVSSSDSNSSSNDSSNSNTGSEARNQESDQDSSVATAAYVGLTLSVLLNLILIAGSGMFCFHKYRRHQRETRRTEMVQEMLRQEMNNRNRCDTRL